jgi:hypothetical protein
MRAASSDPGVLELREDSHVRLRAHGPDHLGDRLELAAKLVLGPVDLDALAGTARMKFRFGAVLTLQI